LTDYRVFETEQFQKDLRHIARSGMPKIVSKLNEYVYPQLRSNPVAGNTIKRLKGAYSGIWRYRIGAWRFFMKLMKSAESCPCSPPLIAAARIRPYF
jgi:mRNA interferase RelE/StbE